MYFDYFSIDKQFIPFLNLIPTIYLSKTFIKTEITQITVDLYNDLQLRAKIQIFISVFKNKNIEKKFCLFNSMIKGDNSRIDLVNQAILQSSPNKEIFIKWLEYLKENKLLLQLIDTILPIWSKPQYTTIVEESIQAVIIEYIKYYLQNIEKAYIKDGMQFNYFLDGIKNHISSSNPSSHIKGSIIGHYFTILFDSDNVIPLPDESNEIEIETDKPDNEEIDQKTVKEETKKRNPNDIIDDSMEYAPSYHEDDSTESSDSSLEPYDLIEPLREEKPKYIKECIMNLQDEENIDKKEIALKSLCELIEKNKKKVHLYTTSLLKTLISMRESFCIKDFEKIKTQCIVKLTVLNPKLSIKLLTKEFFELERDIQHRLNILEYITQSASEITSTKVTTEEEISKRVNQVGRIIRQFTKPKPKHAFKNCFNDVSDLFFYPLLYGADYRNRQIELFGSDKMLLSKLVHSLGVLLECSKNCYNILNYIKSFIELLAVLKYIGGIEIRRPILFSITIIISIYQDFNKMNDIPDELLDFSEWLVKIKSDDPDPLSRDMSNMILSSGIFS